MPLGTPAPASGSAGAAEADVDAAEGTAGGSAAAPAGAAGASTTAGSAKAGAAAIGESGLSASTPAAIVEASATRVSKRSLPRRGDRARANVDDAFSDLVDVDVDGPHAERRRGDAKRRVAFVGIARRVARCARNRTRGHVHGVRHLGVMTRRTRSFGYVTHIA